MWPIRTSRWGLGALAAATLLATAACHARLRELVLNPPESWIAPGPCTEVRSVGLDDVGPEGHSAAQLLADARARWASVRVNWSGRADRRLVGSQATRSSARAMEQQWELANQDTGARLQDPVSLQARELLPKSDALRFVFGEPARAELLRFQAPGCQAQADEQGWERLQVRVPVWLENADGTLAAAFDAKLWSPDLAGVGALMDGHGEPTVSGHYAKGLLDRNPGGSVLLRVDAIESQLGWTQALHIERLLRQGLRAMTVTAYGCDLMASPCLLPVPEGPGVRATLDLPQSR